MLLAIDIGNTQTVLGLYDDDRPGLVHHWRISTQPDRTSDELGLLLRQLLEARSLDPTEVTGIVVSSVVPAATSALRELAVAEFDLEPVVIGPGVRTGLPILIDNPKEVGADRVANALGALDRYEPPLVIVDCGTATTLDAVSARGEYLGGLILPGLEISLDALFERAAGLRRVEIVEPPRRLIGRSTVEALQSGAVNGLIAQVDGLSTRMEEEIGPSTVLATGGLSALIAPLSARIDHHEPWLTLDGLRVVWDRNTG